MNGRLRLARPDDAAGVLAIYEPLVRETFISFEVTPPTRDEMEARIERTLRSLPWLVLETRGGAIAGYAYASPHRERDAYRWSVDVSAYVGAEHRRQGVGRRLYGRLLDLLTRQGYRGAFAGIALPNPASVRLHEAMGFVAIGVYRGVGYKLGGWHDVGWWQRELTGPLADPAPPRPLPALANTGILDDLR